LCSLSWIQPGLEPLNDLETPTSILIAMERHITYQLSPTGEPRVQIINQPYLSNQGLDSPIDSEDENYTEVSSSDKEEFVPVFEEPEKKHNALRASTAPARPLTDIEEFRRSSDFMLLEHTVMCASQLIQRQDQNYDLDSEEGQRACKKFLNQIERMTEVFKVPTSPRSYRSDFSKAYRVLYKDGSLCYLTEILDSAQERIPHLWVNSEKYVFSREVLEAGSRLFNCFMRLQHVLRDLYNRVCEETSEGTVSHITQEIATSLHQFDGKWVEFEQLYVLELMLIESDARRYITQSIDLEKDLQSIEIREKSLGRMVTESEEYHEHRRKLVHLMGQINAVANVEGKGRDDLTIDILVYAESISRRSSSGQSKAVLHLSDQIRGAFSSVRALLRKYDQNIEVVDPQLRHNPELVEALNSFETTWEKGKTYFLNRKRFEQVVFFSNLIETLAEKYRGFREQIECRDAELFLSLPGLLIYRCLEAADHGICSHFFSLMFEETERIGLHWKTLKRAYSRGKLAAFSDQEYKEIVEHMILGIDVDPNQRYQALSQRWDNLDIVLNKIKQIAMEMHRFKPAEWNKFLDVVLGAESVS